MIAIPELAKRIGCSVDEVITICVNSEGPTFNNTTTPNEVRFHDDISTYTGVHSDGHNPSFTPSSSKIALEDLLDRSPADNRGVKMSAEAAASASSSSAQKPKRYTFLFFCQLSCLLIDCCEQTCHCRRSKQSRRNLWSFESTRQLHWSSSRTIQSTRYASKWIQRKHQHRNWWTNSRHQ